MATDRDRAARWTLGAAVRARSRQSPSPLWDCGGEMDQRAVRLDDTGRVRDRGNALDALAQGAAMRKQGDLFPVAEIPAHRDVAAICETCHRTIQIIKYDPATKEVYSEYRDNLGRCYSCASPKRGKA